MSTIVFHGVPQGHDVFGDVIDKYYETFYGNGDTYKSVNVVFVVEVRRDVSGLCSYYSYVRPHNIVAYSGRSGSYFGMTLKVEGQYCTDVYSLYQLFDKIYDEKVIGTIIKQAGNTEQYCIASFADAEYQLKAISQLADNQITANFSSDFEVIDSSFTKQHATTSVYYNLDDVNSESFFSATKVYGKIFISPEYASKDSVISSLSSSDKRYQALKVEYEKQIAELKKENAQIPELKSQLSKLQADCDMLTKQYRDIQTEASSHKNTNTSLSQQLKKTQQELERLKKTSNVVQATDRLEGPLNELLGIMRSVKPSPIPQNPIRTNDIVENGKHRHSPYEYQGSNNNGFRKYIPFILVSLLAIALALLLFRGVKSERKLRDEKTAIEEKYENLQNEYSSLNSEVFSARSPQDTFFTVIYRNDKYKEASFEIYDDSNRPISGPLQLGKKYIVTCIGIEGKGAWKADGFRLLEEKDNNPVIVQVSKADKGVLSYYIDNVDRAISIEYQIR